jgi:hypothetical protein
MLRLLVMLILALAHVRISARRATYGFILQQSQAAQPIAIESASLVDFSISFLQKKMAVLSRVVSRIQSRSDGLVSSLSVLVLSTVLSLPRDLSALFHRLKGIREWPRPCQSRRNTHTHTHPTHTSPRQSHLTQTLLTKA